jgi:transcriptional regulator of acetoin/glycerol metabolism
VIRKVLEEKHWNLSQAAEALGIARGTLYSKIKHYGIEKKLICNRGQQRFFLTC